MKVLGNLTRPAGTVQQSVERQMVGATFSAPFVLRHEGLSRIEKIQWRQIWKLSTCRLVSLCSSSIGGAPYPFDGSLYYYYGGGFICFLLGGFVWISRLFEEQYDGRPLQREKIDRSCEETGEEDK